MIGMNQIKKRLINGILIGLGIGLAFVIVILIVTNNIVKGYEEGTSAKFNEQYMTTVQTFNKDVIQGETITESMIQSANIPKTTVPSDLASDMVGKIAKYNIPRNVAVTVSMLSDYIVGADVRIQEINAIVMPSDLTVGEYVDIRIMMPSGIEYIVLAQKKVNDIVDSTIKLDLSEEEILTLNGAIVDSYLHEGTKLYAVKYADPTTQIKVSEKTMDDAKTYITNKIIEDLVTQGAILPKDVATAVTDDATASENETVSTTTSRIESLVEDMLNSDSDKAENDMVAATSDETPDIPNYEFGVGTLKADELIDMVTKYAIEYRYYVESYNKIKANYKPNEEIIQFMKTSNIIDEANQKISADIRKGIEASIDNFENQTGENYSAITESIESSILTQKALRQEVLGQTVVQQPAE